MNYEALETAIGYRFHNRSYLQLALTHPSFGLENNQRLEFLGDAVLQLVMTDIVYGNTTDTEAKKHLACRLNNITFLIFRHSYRKKAHKSTAFF